MMEGYPKALSAYRVNHLILLVGGNPLPNWVAARLLLKDSSEAQGQPRKIWLLHSDGSDGEPSTKEIAQRLKKLLCKHLFPQIEDCGASNQETTPEGIVLVGIPSADKIGIENHLPQIIQGLKGHSRIGLNYTGGTKPMAVHVYRW